MTDSTAPGQSPHSTAHVSTPRSLRDEEMNLLAALLASRSALHALMGRERHAKVVDMLDGGMGSVRFVGHTSCTLRSKLVEAEYLDLDGVPVRISINADSRGDLYELDFWKTDFSPLVRYPQPTDIKLIE